MKINKTESMPTFLMKRQVQQFLRLEHSLAIVGYDEELMQTINFSASKKKPKVFADVKTRKLVPKTYTTLPSELLYLTPHWLFTSPKTSILIIADRITEFFLNKITIDRLHRYPINSQIVIVGNFGLESADPRAETCRQLAKKCVHMAATNGRYSIFVGVVI